MTHTKTHKQHISTAYARPNRVSVRQIALLRGSGTNKSESRESACAIKACRSDERAGRCPLFPGRAPVPPRSERASSAGARTRQMVVRTEPQAQVHRPVCRPAEGRAEQAAADR